MAVIASGVAGKGIVFRIHDDNLLPRGSPEWERAAAHQRMVAYEILKKWGDHHGTEEYGNDHDERRGA